MANLPKGMLDKIVPGLTKDLKKTSPIYKITPGPASKSIVPRVFPHMTLRPEGVRASRVKYNKTSCTLPNGETHKVNATEKIPLHYNWKKFYGTLTADKALIGSGPAGPAGFGSLERDLLERSVAEAETRVMAHFNSEDQIRRTQSLLRPGSTIDSQIGALPIERDSDLVHVKVFSGGQGKLVKMTKAEHTKYLEHVRRIGGSGKLGEPLYGSIKPRVKKIQGTKADWEVWDEAEIMSEPVKTEFTTQMVRELTEFLTMSRDEIEGLSENIKVQLFECWDTRENEMDFMKVHHVKYAIDAAKA